MPAGLRGVALVPVAALAVHQLRYELAFGPAARHQLAEQGHAYLGSLVPWILLAVGFGAGAWLGALVTTWREPSHDGSARRGLLRTWLATALTLVAIYMAQELLEGLLAAGHPPGPAGVFGDGGWLAVPAALFVAAVVALLMWVGAAIVARVAARRSPGGRRVDVLRLPARRRFVPVPVAALAGCAAGRAPPIG